MGPPTEFILKLKETHDILDFIETGTYYGDTAYWASQVFEQVSTIEYSEEIYKQVTKKYSDIKNINFLYGDTRDKLKDIVCRLNTPGLFWLDAHWSGGETYGKRDECPIIEELRIINCSKHENFILIDDARLFTSPPPVPHSIEQWPDITEILNTLNLDKKRYIVITDDVIIAVPLFARSITAQYYQEINTIAWEKRGRQMQDLGIKNQFRKLYLKFKTKLKSA